MKNYILPMIYVVLVIAIAGAMTFYFMVEPEIPKAPEVAGNPLPTPPVTEPGQQPNENLDQYQHLGKKPLFETLIKKPTPTPTPTPTPKVNPPLDKVLQNWKLVGLNAGEAQFEDASNKSNPYFTMKEGEIKEAVIGKFSMKVKLEKVDTNNFSVTLSGDKIENSGDFQQKHTLKW